MDLSALAFGRRATGGVTAFHVRDPDPYAVDGGRVLGVRFDVFSGRKRGFVPPFFVFLVRVREDDEDEDHEDHEENGDDGRARLESEHLLRVHKHTIPSVVPLAALARRYLPLATAEEDEDVDEQNATDELKKRPVKQDLGMFVRAVRKELVGLVRRKDSLEALEKDCTTRSRGSRLATRFAIIDGLGRDVEMELRKGEIVRIRIDLGGETVEKVIVRGRGSEKGLGQRRRDVERAVLRSGGRLDGITDRIRDAFERRPTI
jgi:central kinetochore subunit Mal2/MCM21